MATQFGQLFRLLMMYSLGRPPKGSNVEGAEVLASLLHPSDNHTDQTAERTQLEIKLDEIVNEAESEFLREQMERKDHDYLETFPDLYAVGYISGFICYTKAAWAPKCEDCYKVLCGSGEENHNKLTKIRSRVFLVYSSTALFNYVYELETVLQNTILGIKMHQHILLDVVDKMSARNFGPNLGCDNQAHRKHLTRGLLRFYIIFRMRTICDAKNELYQQGKQHLKMSRLK
jgi:hypothetical protein